MNHTMWKSMKNCTPKWCCKLCAFLFKVTCAFWKMCIRMAKKIWYEIYSALTCIACDMLSLSLSISWRGLVPRMFLERGKMVQSSQAQNSAGNGNKNLAHMGFVEMWFREGTKYWQAFNQASNVDILKRNPSKLKEKTLLKDSRFRQIFKNWRIKYCCNGHKTWACLNS